MSASLFEFEEVIGRGAFGKVWRVKSRANGKVFALKEINKVMIVQKKSVRSVMNERDILQNLASKYGKQGGRV